MQLRTLALLCSIVGFLYSGLASALGLGEITLKSQYNQPLNAEIRLLKVRDLSEEEILAALASRDDFRRAGVDRVFFLTGLDFEVVLDNPSRPYIRVTTRKPVTEPYLNFLLEVQWPSGRLLREYTLLLDLPVFTQAAPVNATVTAPSTVTSQPAPASARVQSSSSRPVVSGPAPVNTTPAPTSGSQYSQPANSLSSVDNYQVRSGDTLWEIAENVRPDSSISVHQTMIALQQANPEAFVGGNINRLRNGRVLRVPSANEISDISYNQAVNAVRKQNQSWNANTKAVLTSAAPASTASSNNSQPEGRLTLGAADSGQGDVRAAGASGSGDSLQNDLAIAKDELSRSNRENSELKSRLSELESQIETMEGLVKVTNDQLKALQLAAQNEGVPSPADGSITESPAREPSQSANTDQTSEESLSAEDTPVNDAVANATWSPFNDAVVDEPSATSPPVTEETPVVEPPSLVSPVSPSVEDKTGFDFIGIIKRNLLAVGGGLLALLIAILVLLRLREKPEEADYGEFDLAEEDDLFDADELVKDELPEEPAFDSDEDEDVEAQTEDVVAEADIYVSLGQEDKAIELLQKEIQQNPDNADARLGLLKIYAKAQNAVAFDEQYAQLLPLGNVYANDQAMALRKDISDVEPFDTDQYSTEVDSEDAFESLGLGDDSEDELDLDLNLDLDDELDTDLDLDSDDINNLVDNELDELSLDSDLDLDSELDLDLGDLSIDLDDMDDTLGELSLDSDDTSLSLSESDDELEFDLDDNEESFNIVDEMADDLDKLDVDDVDTDDLALDIDSELDSTLDSLDDGLSIAAHGDTAATDMEFDLDFESADAALDDELDLDAPPPEDLDLASLDEEIDAMTADLDESLPLDKEGEKIDGKDHLSELSDSVGDDLDSTELDLDDDPFESSDLNLDDELDLEGDSDLELAEASDEFASGELDSSELDSGELDSIDADVTEDVDVDTLSSSAEEDLAALEDNDDDIDILANSDIDGLAASDDDEVSETTIDDLDSEDLKVASMMDDSSISEDEELDFLEASDEVSTKLDLAKAYIDMGDREGAEDILGEVIEEGNAEQKSEAEELMRTI